MYRQFKQRWYDEYLISLREQSMNLYQSDWTNRIRIGDVVLIRDPMKPRIFWQMGRIVETISGSDSNIRSVKLRKSDSSIAHHSINNLYPLELSITHPDRDNYETPSPKENATHENISTSNQSRRPKRTSALKSQRNWRKIIADP